MFRVRVPRGDFPRYVENCNQSLKPYLICFEKCEQYLMHLPISFIMAVVSFKISVVYFEYVSLGIVLLANKLF